ncbi:MAG: PrsW family intramembrane metalloprotease [Treponema sp.]|nr:PrsW family intramembrane metalloprotease [Treponema sp.]
MLILISSIPAIAAFLWFRLARYPFPMPLFSAALIAGAASLFPALLLQNIFRAGSGIFRLSGKWGLFAEIFIRIALTEELSRFLILLILFAVISRAAGKPISVMANAAGFAAGLGFAILESAVYGASSPVNALLRAFTAAPLHGACGSRVGSSVVLLREHPVRGLFRFLSAVAIHGAYNFMLNIPGRLPLIAAVFIAVSALASAIQVIRLEMKAADNP